MNLVQKIDKALVFCPHPDDEITLVASFFHSLQTDCKEVFVCYYTNGDYREFEFPQRIMESINSLEILGVKRDHVVFLGYPEHRGKNAHFYNSSKYDDNRESITRGAEEFPEYRYLKSKKHSKCLNEDILTDLHDVIIDIKPDLIIYNDFDSHCEHRALSLLVDQAIGKILASDEYSPLILKRFAYNGSHVSPNDYYTRKPAVFHYSLVDCRGKSVHCIDSPYCTESNCLRIPSDFESLTDLVACNYIFKAAKKHKSQLAYYMVYSVCNSDWPCWVRRTDSISYKASIYTSSGSGQPINDFMLYDCSDIVGKKEFSKQFDKGIWRPISTDKEKYVDFQFKEKKCIQRIVIYEAVAEASYITKGRLLFDGSEEIVIDFTGYDRFVISIDVPCIHCKNIRFQILDFVGEDFGITEIEVYDEMNQYSELLDRWVSRSQLMEKTNISLAQKTEKFWLQIRWYYDRITRKIKRMILTRMSRKWDKND